MANSIQGFQPLHELPRPPLTAQPAAPDSGESGVHFQQLLLDSLSEVSGMEQTAHQAIEQRLAGDDITNVEVFSAVKKAELALSMMLQIRNKLLEAYDEIKQMQL